MGHRYVNTVTEEWGRLKDFQELLKGRWVILKFCGPLSVFFTVSELKRASISYSTFSILIWDNIHEKKMQIKS